jgi:hypothetical protein
MQHKMPVFTAFQQVFIGHKEMEMPASELVCSQDDAGAGAFDSVSELLWALPDAAFFRYLALLNTPEATPLRVP